MLLKTLMSMPISVQRQILERYLTIDGRYLPMFFDNHKDAIKGISQIEDLKMAIVDLDEPDGDGLVSRLAETFPAARILGVHRQEFASPKDINPQCHLNIFKSACALSIYDGVCQLGY